LPWSCDPQSLREEFSQCELLLSSTHATHEQTLITPSLLILLVGNVTDCFIPRDRETGRPRGFGFVTFDTTDSANSSVESMNGKEYGGRTLKVNLAQGR
jgi:RNA recognition motif-containing protein